MALNRVDLRRLIMGITNHNNLKYHQNLHDDTINPTCRFCRLYDETFDHFFTCQYFQGVRDHMDIRWPYSETDPWQVDKIIMFINDTEIKQALDRRDLQPIRTPEAESEISSEEEMEITEELS